MEERAFLDDLSEENTAPTATLMAEISAYVQTWTRLKEDVAKKEEELAEAKKKERDMSEKLLPGLFNQHKLSSLTLDNGVTVYVKEDLSAGIPEDELKAKRALDWLSKNGGGDLIRDTVSIVDPPKAVIDLLVESGMDYDRAKKVHAGQLKAWLREMLGMKKNTLAKMEPGNVAPELGLYRYSKIHLKGAN